jgi:hypothetical protein
VSKMLAPRDPVTRTPREKLQKDCGEKKCRKCGREKAVSEFPRNRRVSDGFSSWCRACHAEACRDCRARQREAARERQWKRQQEHNRRLMEQARKRSALGAHLPARLARRRPPASVARERLRACGRAAAPRWPEASE